MKRTALGGVLLLGAVSCPAQPGGETTKSLLAEAVRQTAKKNLPAAEQNYRKAATLDPASGYPALARFLYLTKQTSAARQLLSDPALADSPPLVRARVAVESGQPEVAVRELRKPAPPGTLYAQTRLLVTQLRRLERAEEAGKALAAALGSPELAPMERMDLVKALGEGKDCGSLAAAIPVAAESLVSSTTLDFEVVRQTVWETVMSMADCPGFGAFDKTLHAMPRRSAVITWLAALADIRRGDSRAAYQILTGIDRASLSARERSVINQELAILASNDPVRALQLREEILPLEPQSDRLHLEAAQLALGLGQLEKSRTYLEKITPSRLDETGQSAYAAARCALTALQGTPEQALKVFSEHGKGLRWPALQELAASSYGKLPAARCVELRQAALQALRETSAPVELHALLFEMERRGQTEEGLLAALAGYCKARPEDTTAEQVMAEVAGSMAVRLGAPGGEGSAQGGQTSRGAMKTAADRAAASLWKVVEAQPYAPESYGKLMELYRFCGEPDKARRVPQYLTSSTTAPAEAVALAAFIYATNGFPDEAIPLYERALKQDPKHPRYRLNYAGALTRVGRFDEAEKIFHELIRQGYQGHQYHTHELYLGAWQLAEQRDRLAAYLDFLRSLMNDPAVPERDVFLIDTAKLLVTRGRAGDALPFLETAARAFPARKADAREEMIEAYVALKEFPKAEELAGTMEKESTSTADLLRARYNFGILKSSEGKPEEAIGIWRKIAEENPRDRQAGKSLLAAAQTLLQMNRLPEAQQTLQQYLASGMGDADGEAAARQMVEEIGKRPADENPALPADSATAPGGGNQ